ncbi:hypothetical protein BJY01DRAFT_206259 [Aspergillus pseudoustus]|uniref:Uncharacterized protein n=1 Tax=Aspergillus pseudoustus TaxID=1810923 RepID=A0ABR4KNA4_9EURO
MQQDGLHRAHCICLCACYRFAEIAAALQSAEGFVGHSDGTKGAWCTRYQTQ